MIIGEKPALCQFFFFRLVLVKGIRTIKKSFKKDGNEKAIKPAQKILRHYLRKMRNRNCLDYEKACDKCDEAKENYAEYKKTVTDKDPRNSLEYGISAGWTYIVLAYANCFDVSEFGL